MIRDASAASAPRRAGMRQVAKEAGVSPTTVSNVLNNPELVAEETRRRVHAAMERVGYLPNDAARRLRGAPSPLVGAVTLDIAGPFFTEVCRGVEDRLLQDGCMLMTCSTDLQPGREQHYLQELEKQGVRGVLITPVETDLDPLVTLAGRGVPVVLLDHRSDGRLCSVSIDNQWGGEQVATHLIELGHRRIALLGASIEVQQTAERHAGVRRAFERAGLDPGRGVLDVRVPSPDITVTAAAALEDVLSAADPPTAILCLNDAAALGVIGGLRERGIAVPQEMSVVGYDDVAFAAQLAPPLTTVWQPKRELGRVAAELLLDEARPGHRHQKLVYRPRLVVRESTAAPRR
ncbi:MULTISPECIES: LacI family DNA-binding transcriptional regulator [Nonomuraea]|uniref:LacI family DNA-binding transcriptional regulator n=2 Tax=Nonomuraea TaxID=83681 RepID=A0ABW1C205_9ACTN|nr:MULTISPECIES: LacI family DNA-binding transcriptional regulator [Nonomuraea]MDA0641567.1 LacI family DNA-binding transcriptional regulator [Nonomuraea ferruginea]TXK42305.1 LacI family transcriptional regulator [Nonomuraea sp. C10]